ncbi:MAG TPA: hypothetical protein VGS19_34405 [Streptosporangiaceae bacterium]|nr:hypothetical protein [Streptosporangiaceae bacterium]
MTQEIVTADRFDYALNLSRAGSYHAWRGAFWPPTDTYAVSHMDLAEATPPLGDGFLRGLAALKATIEAEWATAKRNGGPDLRRFTDPDAVAAAMRDLAQFLPTEADRRALTLRAQAVCDGYTPDALAELFGVAEDVAVVGGHITTWPGKQAAGLPTAFACARDKGRQDIVADAIADKTAVTDYLRDLHADLRLGELPVFTPTNLFFMAGEGNFHPKHIAYFLPEDEGVKGSAFNKTYYFANTHRALLSCLSAPLAARFLRVGVTFDPAAPQFSAIPVLGVLSHEFGHFVHRPATTFEPLHAESSWISGVLQETAADVFGVLVLTEVWADRLGLSPADVIAYYLAECLRYTSRGLGCFPDSDGMFLQLSYLVQLGALSLEPSPRPCLSGDPGTVLAGLRSLARVLADALLAGEAAPALALHSGFGPGTPSPLRDLVAEVRGLPLTSVEYQQDHIYVA